MLFFLTACSLFAGEDSGNPECTHEPPLSYENFGQEFLTTHCVGCHSSLYTTEERREGAPIGVDFDTYERVLQWATQMEVATTGVEPTMPPGGGPGADEIVLFTEWLHCQVAEDVQRYQEGG
jgi:uncharacterized membrane protein